jgi:hypothetical protein
MNSRRGRKHSSENSRATNRRPGRDELLLIRALFRMYPPRRVRNYNPGPKAFCPGLYVGYLLNKTCSVGAKSL